MEIDRQRICGRAAAKRRLASDTNAAAGCPTVGREWLAVPGTNSPSCLTTARVRKRYCTYRRQIDGGLVRVDSQKKLICVAAIGMPSVEVAIEKLVQAVTCIVRCLAIVF
jgi:hypothetical protein